MPTQASPDEVVGLLAVTPAPQLDAPLAAALDRLRAADVGARLLTADATLWGPAAEAEASIRLGWLDTATRSLDLLPRLTALRAELLAEGLDRVVLCGMGGSSLAPEVICRQAGVPLVVLDATHPDQVRAALTDLTRTVVVVSSKSGGTVETDSQRRAFADAFAAAGLDAGRHLVVVTDPGSPFEALAAELGARAVFLADPHVGGRFSALTAFGLVPSALAGADVEQLLQDASAPGVAAAGLLLGAALGADPRRRTLLLPDGPGAPGFGDWAEQLVAESTGKDGVGVLPVACPPDAAELGLALPDTHVVAVGAPGVAAAPGVPLTTVQGALGALFLAFEHATAVLGVLLGINPFDQPDVESAKVAARAVLDAPAQDSVPTPAAGLLVTRPGATGAAAVPVEDAADAIAALLAEVPTDGYLAVMAYLDRHRDAPVAQVRQTLAARTRRPVTFGWGPRFLHSTGQLHKGGPATGVFLQLTGAVEQDLPVPGRPFTFGSLVTAQADGDAAVLAAHGRPVLRVTLGSPADLAALLDLLA